LFLIDWEFGLIPYNGTLRSLIAGPFQRGEEHLRLKDIAQHNFWNLGGVSISLPNHLSQKIKATPFSITAAGVDRIAWASSPNGEFNLKEAYKLACIAIDFPRDLPFTGAWVWKVNTFPKVRCFLWQCLHRSIPVREVLVARGINIPTLYPLYNDAIETIIHTLRDYPQARIFWDSLLPSNLSSWFYNINLGDWLHLNCASNLSFTSGISWGTLFPFGVWSLWLRQNKVVFGNNPNHKSLMTETLAKAAEFAFLGAHTKARRITTSIQVRWNAPPDRWFKLNSDGSPWEIRAE